MLIAIGHILGSILAALIFGGIVLAIYDWHSERSKKERLEEIAIKLGVAIQDIENEEVTPRILEVVSEKYSNEHLGNRVSDLCGYIRTIWEWIGLLIQIGVFVSVCWFTFTENITNAEYAWFIPVTAVVFWLCSVAFALTCRLLTGRYPGEAKQARKSAVEFLSSKRTQSESKHDEDFEK